MAFHKFFIAVRNGEPITVYGTGRQTRDFTYVDDIVAAEPGRPGAGPGRRGLQRRRRPPRDPRPHPPIMESVCGRPVMIAGARTRKATFLDTSADIAKASRELRFAPADAGLSRRPGRRVGLHPTTSTRPASGRGAAKGTIEMKKIIAALAAVLLVASAAGCGKKPKPQTVPCRRGRGRLLGRGPLQGRRDVPQEGPGAGPPLFPPGHRLLPPELLRPAGQAGRRRHLLPESDEGNLILAAAEYRSSSGCTRPAPPPPTPSTGSA